MILTNNEKMVWAATFALCCEELKNPPSHVLKPNEWVKWEEDVVASAAEAACYRVEHLRKVIGRLRSGYGTMHNVTLMAVEMISEKGLL